MFIRKSLINWIFMGTLPPKKHNIQQPSKSLTTIWLREFYGYGNSRWLFFSSASFNRRWVLFSTDVKFLLHPLGDLGKLRNREIILPISNDNDKGRLTSPVVYQVPRYAISMYKILLFSFICQNIFHMRYAIFSTCRRIVTIVVL